MSDSPEPKRLCRSSSESEYLIGNQSNEERECVEYRGRMLTYDTLLEVFSTVRAKDLCNCIQVCQLWKEAALKTLSRRRPELRTLDIYEVFESCGPDSFPNDLMVKPMLGVVITTRHVRPTDCFARHLPQRCISLIIRGFGSIMNGCEYENGDVGVCAFLPESNNVNIELMMGSKTGRCLHFNKNLQRLNPDYQPNRLSAIEPMFRRAAERLGEIKCMILITTEQFRNDEKLSEMGAIKDNVSSLWGGVVRNLTISKRDTDGISHSENVLWAAILIAGEEVRSWSVVIDRKICTKHALKKRLEEMKNKTTFYRHTVGLMLACIGRGNSLWGEHSVEASTFKEVFPDIPLLGTFGQGEFGFSFDDNSPNRRAHRSHSTSFVIITYN